MATAVQLNYYVKSNNRVRGPFAVAKLCSMQQRKQIIRETLVSEDRRGGWVPAETLVDVFPETGWERKTPTTFQDMLWYYAVDGEKQGPYSFEELNGLTSAGTVAPYDHVISETMTDWIPADQVGGLDFVLVATVKSDKRSTLRYVTIASAVLLVLAILPAGGVLVMDHLRVSREEEELKHSIEVAEQREHEMDIAEIKADAVRTQEQNAERRNEARVSAIEKASVDEQATIKRESAKDRAAIRDSAATVAAAERDGAAAKREEASAIDRNTEELRKFRKGK